MITFIDLFSGLSGIRIGFENAAKRIGEETTCVLTSEIKKIAIEALNHRYPNEKVDYDIYDVNADLLPDGADVILGGFPCQPFSSAGKGLGFLDTRGTLFFEIERIIKELQNKGQKPRGFILENVEGLVKHGGVVKNSKYGKTLNTIIKKLDLAGYNVNVQVLNASDYGVPQARKRVYIIGVAKEIGTVNLIDLPRSTSTIEDILEKGLPTENTPFTRRLLNIYKAKDLEGKCIKDKRGGSRNIHSWDLEIKGKVSNKEKEFLNLLLKERRKKKWAEIIGIDWMDGMPLTTDQIATFYPSNGLQKMLDKLTREGYLVYEHPKKKKPIKKGGIISYTRVEDETKPKGYNIVTGKLSLDFCQFLDPSSIAPTMVAMDMERIGVVDGDGIRHLTINEGLRLFGYNDYDLNYLEGRKDGRSTAFDLLGNSVCVPVIELLAERLINVIR